MLNKFSLEFTAKEKIDNARIAQLCGTAKGEIE
jgi:hypothetical protein